jgi:hypothetical protein
MEMVLLRGACRRGFSPDAFFENELRGFGSISSVIPNPAFWVRDLLLSLVVSRSRSLTCGSG